MKEVDRPDPGSRISAEPGEFLSRTGLSKEDVLESRLPAIPSGGLAVVSNGLANDLLEIAETSPGTAAAVAKFIFHFLELSFPPTLLGSAIQKTMAYIQENNDYVTSCRNKKEAENFLFSPFVLPKEVSEMASIYEDWDQEELESVPAEEEAMYTETLVPSESAAYTDTSATSALAAYSDTSALPGDTENLYNNILCGINIVNNGCVETFEISSLEDMIHNQGNLASVGEETHSWDTQQVGLNIFIEFLIRFRPSCPARIA